MSKSKQIKQQKLPERYGELRPGEHFVPLEADEQTPDQLLVCEDGEPDLDDPDLEVDKKKDEIFWLNPKTRLIHKYSNTAQAWDRHPTGPGGMPFFVISEEDQEPIGKIVMDQSVPTRPTEAPLNVSFEDGLKAVKELAGED
jgi:hypothetical protein